MRIVRFLLIAVFLMSLAGSAFAQGIPQECRDPHGRLMCEHPYCSRFCARAPNQAHELERALQEHIDAQNRLRHARERALHDANRAYDECRYRFGPHASCERPLNEVDRIDRDLEYHRREIERLQRRLGRV